MTAATPTLDPRLAQPFTLTRQITHRLLCQFTADGKLRFLKDDGSDAAGSVDLPRSVGPSEDYVPEVLASFDLGSSDHCGAAYVVPAGWHQYCRGEGTAVLGNVSFDVLAGVARPAYAQRDRFNCIRVRFRYEAGRATITTEIGKPHSVDGQTSHVYPLAKAYLVAFVAFRETGLAQPDPAKNTTLTFSTAAVGLKLPGQIVFA